MPNAAINAEHPIVLYDGVCGLCNRSVGMILRRDPAGIFRFAALQGEFARAALARHSAQRAVDGVNNETMYVVLAPGTDAERLLSGADAALYIAGRVRGPLRAAPAAAGWLPRALRNALYAFIARRRYRWFGKYDQCPLPEPQWQERFLE